MLISIFQIAFFNQYIVSPKTWIHKIPHRIKIIFILTYLLFMPYIHYKYIILLMIIYTTIFLNLPIPKYYIISVSQSLFIFLLCFFNIYININNICTHISINSSLNILRENRCKIYRIHYTDKYLNTKNQIIATHTIPIYIFRGTIIYITYLALLKILYLTTKYEKIIESYMLVYKHHIKKTYFIQNIFIIILGSEFIILLLNKIDTTTKAIVLRGSTYKYIYYYALHDLLASIYFDIIRVSSALYYREIYSNQ